LSYWPELPQRCPSCGTPMSRWKTPPMRNSYRLFRRRFDAWICPKCDGSQATALAEMQAQARTANVPNDLPREIVNVT